MSREITDFGELRSALQSADEVSRKRAWRSVYMFFRGHLARRAKTRDPRVVEEWLPYAVQSLERWPDRLRYLPREDLESLLDGKNLGEVMQLVRAVRVTQPTLSKRSDMFSLPAFTWVRHVTFGPGVFDASSYAQMKDSEVFAGVTSLEIQHPSSNYVRLATLLRAPFAPNLRHLGLVHCRLDGAKLKTLSRWKHRGHLESLDLSHNPRISGEWGHLADAELDGLRALNVSGSWTDREDLEQLLDASWLPQLQEFHAKRAYDALGEDISFMNRSSLEIAEVRIRLARGPDAVSQLWTQRYAKWTKAEVKEVIKRLERMLRQINRREGIQELIEASALDPELTEHALEPEQ